MEVGLGAREARGVSLTKRLDTGVGLEVDLDVLERAVLGTAKLIRVVSVAAHATQGRGDAARPEQLHEAVHALLVAAVEVPEHGGVRGVGPGVALVGPVQTRELGRVPDEEHRHVVTDEVPVPLLREQLQREAPHVPRRVGRSALPRDERQAREHLGLLAYLAQEGCRR